MYCCNLIGIGDSEFKISKERDMNITEVWTKSLILKSISLKISSIKDMMHKPNIEIKKKLGLGTNLSKRFEY